jgi:hypothetical protein
VFRSWDELLTAETKDSAFGASFSEVAGAKAEGAAVALSLTGALSGALPTIPLMAAASLGFAGGFSTIWEPCWVVPGCCASG